MYSQKLEEVKVMKHSADTAATRHSKVTCRSTVDGGELLLFIEKRLFGKLFMM